MANSNFTPKILFGSTIAGAAAIIAVIYSQMGFFATNSKSPGPDVEYSGIVREMRPQMQSGCEGGFSVLLETSDSGYVIANVPVAYCGNNSNASGVSLILEHSRQNGQQLTLDGRIDDSGFVDISEIKFGDRTYTFK